VRIGLTDTSDVTYRYISRKLFWGYCSHYCCVSEAFRLEN